MCSSTSCTLLMPLNSVLNGRADGDARIAPETRDRVLRAIAETGYVADPIARRLVARHNRILGVFTYESVFPTETSDFYQPFLAGIEDRAETFGCDLLLLTSTPVIDGRRRLFHEGSRLRLADGCVLLGRSLDAEDLTRLVADGWPFVSVGRREDAGGPVPYVGANYPAAVAALVRQAAALGHTHLAYLGQGAGPESHADRMRGFLAAVAETRVTGWHEPVKGLGQDQAGGGAGTATGTTRGAVEVLDALVARGVTAVLAEDHADGVALAEAASARGLAIPGDLSLLSLGDPVRRSAPTSVEFTGFRIPRRQLGCEAVEVLTALIEDTPTGTQRLLDCELVRGATLGPPPAN